MPLRLVTPPAAMPVSLEDAKEFCRVQHDFDNALISELIASATEHVEQVTGLQLVAAEYELQLSDWPRDGIIRLPKSPFLDLTSLQCRRIDEVGLTTLAEGTDFHVDEVAMPAQIYPDLSWPRLIDAHDAVIVRWTAGFAADEGSPIDHTANVPARARVAVKCIVSHFYENRTPIEFATPHKMPEHLDRLLNGLRVWKVS